MMAPVSTLVFRAKMAVAFYLRELVHRVRRRGRSAALRSLRLTGAAVASYLVADALLSGAVPILAPLTALLVVEVTLAGSVTSGVQRIISVVAGVFIAVGFSALVELSWWSLGGLIAASIVVGQVLKLGPHLLEVPISAMLVLAVGGAEAAARDRIVETLIGAFVGVSVNLMFPPAVRPGTAAAAVQSLAEEIAELLDRAGAELFQALSQEQAFRWLEDARDLTRQVPRVDRALAHVEASRRLNRRALGVPDSQQSLRGGADALEHTVVAVRSMFRSLFDAIAEGAGADTEQAEDLRLAFAVLLQDLATAVRAFGRLVRAEVDSGAEVEERALAAALETLLDARARLTELMLVDTGEDRELWALNSAVLETVERMLRELDVADHIRLRVGRREEARRRLAPMAAQRLRARTRALTDLPHRRWND
jgi:Fusaric acid resistance protein-like